MSTWQKRLNDSLAKQGMKQEDLAEKLGKSPAAVSHWVLGRRTPKHDEFASIAKILDVAPVWLAYGTEGEVNDKVLEYVHHTILRLSDKHSIPLATERHARLAVKVYKMYCFKPLDTANKNKLRATVLKLLGG